MSTYLGLFNTYTHGAHCVPGTVLTHQPLQEGILWLLILFLFASPFSRWENGGIMSAPFPRPYISTDVSLHLSCSEPRLLVRFCCPCAFLKWNTRLPAHSGSYRAVLVAWDPRGCLNPSQSLGPFRCSGQRRADPEHLSLGLSTHMFLFRVDSAHLTPSSKDWAS